MTGGKGFKNHNMMIHREVETQLHAFLTSALNASEWSVSHPGYFIPGERTPATHCLGGQVNSRSFVDPQRRKYFIC
jgi:hypothetical protein